MPLVQGQHPRGVVALSQDHEGGVSQANPQILILLRHGDGMRDIPRAELGQPEDTRGDLSLQLKLCLDSRPREEHVIEFGEDKGRQDRRTAVVLVGCPGLLVRTHIMPSRREQAACVDENHCKPNPSARISSTLNGRSGSPNSMVPSILERGRGSSDSSHPSIALRMIRASESPDTRAASSRRSLSSSGRYTVVFTIRIGYPMMPYTAAAHRGASSAIDPGPRATLMPGRRVGAGIYVGHDGDLWEN